MAFDLDEEEYEATRKLNGVGREKTADEIKVGEYVRTKGGHIHKVTKIDDNKLVYWGKIQCGWSLEQLKDITVKHSSNIIDLIEVGDYVNGQEVVVVYGYDEDGNDKDTKGIIETDDDYAYGVFLEDINIYSIVTKEQFKSIEYIVKE